MRALWRDSEDRFTVIAYVDNALNRDIANSVILTRLQTGATSAALYPLYGLNFPRQIGVEIQKKF